MKGQPFRRRLGFAVVGLRTIWRHEASFRTQVRLAGAAVLSLLVLRPGAMWAGLVIVATGLVLAAEAMNAALEHLCDTVHPDIAPGIKAAKDSAAAAVLIASVAAVGVATMLLLALA